MLINIILIVIALIAIFIASIFDIKTKEIPNWLTYNFIIIALMIRLFYSIISKEYFIFLYGLIGAISLFTLGSLMYYTKQWGGGDTKLLAGIGASLAFSVKFIILFLVITLITGALYGITWSIYLAIKHKRKFLNEFKKNDKKTYIKNITIILLISIIISYIFLPFKIKIIVISFFLLFLIYIYLLFLIKIIEKACMYKTIPPFKLTEGDWIAKNIYINKKLIASPKDKGITKKQISLLKKSKIKQVIIKEGIPFVPVFLISALISLLFI